MKNHAAPIIAALFLLLPMLYVGSYFAVVIPEATPMERIYFKPDGGMIFAIGIDHYRWGRDRAAWFYWPLEQIDRQLRPKLWEEP